MEVSQHHSHLGCQCESQANSVLASPQNHPASSLWLATSVVVLGTCLIDLSRVTLLLVPISFLVAAYGAGILLGRTTGSLAHLASRAPLLNLAVHLGVGVACLSVIVLSAAFCGILLVAGLVGFALMGYGLIHLSRAHLPVRSLQWSPWHVVGSLVLGLTWLVAWLWATIPPTFFDELAYHLVIPQHSLVTGSLHTTPTVYFTLMPHASDLLLTWGMAFGGGPGARATQFALWVACSLAASGVAEVVASRQSRSRVVLVTASLLASSPTLWFLATLSFAETCLTLAVLSAAAVVLFAEPKDHAWLPLGLVLGLTAIVKLTGLYWIAAVVTAALVAGWTLGALARAGLVALIMVLPWWLRAMFHTGNPIYPMAYQLFGGTTWSSENQARVVGDLPPNVMDLGFTGILRLPLDLILHPERFGSASDAGPVAVLSVCGVLLLPALMRVVNGAADKRRRGNALAIFLLVAGVGWVLTSTTVRFFAPALVLSLATLSGVVLRLKPKPQMLLLPLILAAGAIGITRFIGQHSSVFSSTEVALGREPGVRYLARQLDHYQAARYVQKELPANAYVLFIGETRPYYFFRNAIAPSAYDRHPLRQWVVESSSEQALVARLKEEGITHVVLNVREFKRIHDKYGVLGFSGANAEAHDRLLKRLPSMLRTLFAKSGMFVFEVPLQAPSVRSEG